MINDRNQANRAKQTLQANQRKVQKLRKEVKAIILENTSLEGDLKSFEKERANRPSFLSLGKTNQVGSKKPKSTEQ